MKDLGDKITDSDKQPVVEAIEKLRKTILSGDTEAIKADTEALEKAFYAISEKLYGGAAGGADMGGNGGQNSDGSYDADFTDSEQ
jgi:molecular chaperone DnaK